MSALFSSGQSVLCAPLLAALRDLLRPGSPQPRALDSFPPPQVGPLPGESEVPLQPLKGGPVCEIPRNEEKVVPGEGLSVEEETCPGPALP